jgi:hypothetical protein
VYIYIYIYIYIHRQKKYFYSYAACLPTYLHTYIHTIHTYDTYLRYLRYYTYLHTDPTDLHTQMSTPQERKRSCKGKGTHKRTSSANKRIVGNPWGHLRANPTVPKTPAEFIAAMKSTTSTTQDRWSNSFARSLSATEVISPGPPVACRIVEVLGPPFFREPMVKKGTERVYYKRLLMLESVVEMESFWWIDHITDTTRPCLVRIVAIIDERATDTCNQTTDGRSDRKARGDDVLVAPDPRARTYALKGAVCNTSLCVPRKLVGPGGSLRLRVQLLTHVACMTVDEVKQAEMFFDSRAQSASSLGGKHEDQTPAPKCTLAPSGWLATSTFWIARPGALLVEHNEYPMSVVAVIGSREQLSTRKQRSPSRISDFSCVPSTHTTALQQHKKHANGTECASAGLVNKTIGVSPSSQDNAFCFQEDTRAIRWFVFDKRADENWGSFRSTTHVTSTLAPYGGDRFRLGRTPALEKWRSFVLCDDTLLHTEPCTGLLMATVHRHSGSATTLQQVVPWWWVYRECTLHTTSPSNVLLRTRSWWRCSVCKHGNLQGWSWIVPEQKIPCPTVFGWVMSSQLQYIASTARDVPDLESKGLAIWCHSCARGLLLWRTRWSAVSTQRDLARKSLRENRVWPNLWYNDPVSQELLATGLRVFAAEGTL